MFEHAKKSFVSLLLLIVIFTSNSFATVMIKFSIADLTKEADNIIIGKVINKKSEWSLNRTQIFTYITIEIEREIKGSIGENPLIIKQLGGEVGGMGQKVIGSPEFNVNEEVALFLNKFENGWQVVGMMQGKYNIVEDTASGKKKVVSQAESKVMFMKANGEKDDAPEATPMSLDEFLGMINANLK